MKTFFPALLLIMTGMPAALAQTAPVQAVSDRQFARQIAATCAGCHDTNGHAQGNAIPSLAGRSREELTAQMQAFRSGARPGTIMQQLAKGYSSEQIDAIAAYLAAQSRESAKGSQQ
ncbi:c-type cytochrome [Noviherbaspirillum galbum]|uniref:C-type cytochrome n=1 Tax=Noviherbaspirillum galbum TaxID=2709383 RepID=A0A6B3SYK5_9BURK|nr:c-type cytochrome [Noviherbaspirillum galbum]NEX63099.1 c-type cytochrome [Noviherbaspirillum galbum]